MKLAVPLALALTITAPLAAQSTFSDPANLRGERVRSRDGRELPVDQGARGVQQLLRKLSTRASLMLIVAHPDDEDGGMLTYYSRGFGARVATLTLTRGEGGQNAMTGDFEDALGLLRTQELLSADRYLGVDQFFGTEVDFGFSKTKEEAFRKWTHERVLYDAVRAIRLYRPLVIVAMFVGGVTDGHGQHQVSGQIAQEAFKAAGDPAVFPDMIAEGILPWQPLKVYARVPQGAITDQGLFDYATGQYTPARFTNYVTGEVTTTEPSADVIVHEGVPDPLLADENGKPRSYVQFARLGLGLQKSQIGPGNRTAPSGAFDIAYHRYGSVVHTAHQRIVEETFYDGIDTSLEGIASLAPDTPAFLQKALEQLERQVTEATRQLDPGKPAGIAPLLAEALHGLDGLLTILPETTFGSPGARDAILQELHSKRAQLNDALTLALGLRFDATVHGADQLVTAQPVLATDLRVSADTSLTVKREWLENAAGTTRDADSQRERTAELTPEHPFNRTLRTAPLPNAPPSGIGLSTLPLVISRPYFDRDSIETPVYHLKTAALRNAPSTPPALTAWATVSYKGVPITIGRIVHDGPQPVAFVPTRNVLFGSGYHAMHAQVLADSARALIVSVVTDPDGPHIEHEVVRAPKGWAAHINIEDTLPPGYAHFTVDPPPQRTPATLHAVLSLAGGQIMTESYRAIGYGDMPRTNYFTPADLQILPVNLNLPARHRLAYLPGTGDAVPEALASIGLQSDTLAIADLTPANLARYDTVILGVRTYNAHPDLHGAPTQALLDYARDGGNVVVQYQTPEFTAADAPYSLSLGSNEKVVDETAPVRLLDSANSLLTTPNKIASSDFDSWVEERGHGFLSSWDSRYTALTETHDPGSEAEHVAPQQPQRGALITTPLGKGRWTYCAFALYRQLPEAVPGAFRLLVNLLNH